MVGLFDTIFQGLVGLGGSTWLVGIVLLILILVLLAITNASFEEFWLVLLPVIGSLTPRYGGSLLPDWALLIAVIPFVWLMGDALMKWWGGGTNA